MARHGNVEPQDSNYYNEEQAVNELLNAGVVGASGASLSSVADSASSQVLLSANTARKGCVIHNDSTAILRIAFAATCSATAFTYRLVPQAAFTMSSPVYQGIISGIWESDASGSARITELS